MSSYDLSHVTDIGMEFSAGPSVSTWDLTQQLFRQQWHVGSQLALDEELRTRWSQSLQALRTSGQNFREPVDPLMHRQYAQFVRDGTPVTMPTTEGTGYGARINYDNQQPHTDFLEMQRADEAIRQLNNPEIKTFEQILAEVGEMQRGVEEETASMSERAGWFANLVAMSGSIAGSFTLRDPLNVVTAPVGFGRTVAMRIASDMGIAGLITGVTEFADIAPNRALAGLPEGSPLANIGYSIAGAGIIRGGIEGIGYGIGRLRAGREAERAAFDLRDTQLQQMFEANSHSPTARAGAQALDDMLFIERNNPYGEGQAANLRFVAELQNMQRVMGGEPATAVARVLPPLPFEYIQKEADFQLVKDQAPLVYARMERWQNALREVNAALEQFNEPQLQFTLREGPFVNRRVSVVTEEGTPPPFLYRIMSKAELEAAQSSGSFRSRSGTIHASGEPFWVYSEPGANNVLVRYDFDPDDGWRAKQAGVGVVAIADEIPFERATVLASGTRDDLQGFFEGVAKRDVRELRNEQRVANLNYQKAYKEVEDEAARIHEEQVRVENAQQRQAVNIFVDATYGRPFNYSLLQHDFVQARVDAINAFNDTLDEKAVAAFIRQTETEGEEVLGRETWRTEDGRIDIGLKQPVNPDFRITTDDGDVSIVDAMRDLQDDADLDEAMRNCLL